MSSLTQQKINQNPDSAVIIDNSNNDAARLNAESGASSSPLAVTVDVDTLFAMTSSKSFIEMGGTLKRNAHATKNEVWTYFQVYNEKKFHTHAFCVLCKSDVSYGKTHSTSNLEKNIQRKHKTEYDIIMAERANKRLKIHAEISFDATSYKQKLLSNYTVRSDDYQECLVKWMVNSYQPLSVVQSDAFRNMVKALNNKAPVIGEDKIRTLISNKYYDTMHAIIKILKGKDVALTTDAWTSISKEGYVTATIHFIEPQTWKLHNFSLGIFKKDGNSTAVDVVCYAESHMHNFNLTYSQLTCVVTDTEATMVAAGCLFKEKSNKAGGCTEWHGCIDHKLELVTKLAFKDIGTMAACRAIVAFFNSSSQATDKLKEKTKARLGVSLTVIQDAVTCWWSTFSMCERLLHLRTSLTVMYLDGDMRLYLTEAQWVIVKDMVALLKPFMLAQRLLEGQSYITISLIPHMLYKIRSGLMAANLDPMASQQVRTVSTIMLRKFNEEFGTGEENTVSSDHLVEGNRWRLKGLPKIVMIAMYLDPRTKSAVDIPLADRDVIWQFVFDDLLNLALQLGPPPADAAILPNVREDAQPLAQEVICNNVVGHADDVIDFLHELDENEAEDDLQELIDANNNPVIVIQGAEDTWNHSIAGEFIRAEIVSY